MLPFGVEVGRTTAQPALPPIVIGEIHRSSRFLLILQLDVVSQEAEITIGQLN